MSYRWAINDTTENRVVPAFGNPSNANTQKVHPHPQLSREGQRAAYLRRLERGAKRKAVSERTNHQCFYCGSKDIEWTFEHLIPRSKGGGNYKRNLVRACYSCNTKRGCSTEIVKFMTCLDFVSLAHEAEQQMKQGRKGYEGKPSPRKIKASRIPCCTPLSELISPIGPYPVSELNP